MADHDMARAKAFAHHLGGERLGAQPGEPGFEIDDEDLVEPQRLDQLELERQRRQAEERLVRLEELARMRFEQHGA